MSARREIHSLAAFVHGALAALHTLGALYNARKGNRWQAFVHVAGIAFSVQSVIHHVQETQERNDG